MWRSLGGDNKVYRLHGCDVIQFTTEVAMLTDEIAFYIRTFFQNADTKPHDVTFQRTEILVLNHLFLRNTYVD